MKRTFRTTSRRRPWDRRCSLLETLERRNLLAGDVAPAIPATDPDAWEPNNSFPAATIVPADDQVVFADLTIHTEADVDFYRIAPAESGALTATIYFDHDAGNLELALLDRNGNLLASSTSTSDDESLVSGVVEGEQYFLLVRSLEEAVNNYSLQLHVAAIPVVSGVFLDTVSDTGMSDSDWITLDSTPRFLVQADRGPLTNLADDAFVQVRLANAQDGTIVTGTATAIGEDLFAWEPEALPAGRYLVSARWGVRDGQQSGEGEPNSAVGFGISSHAQWMTLDLAAPSGSEPILANGSDSGMSQQDRVTNKMQPFFTGITEANTKVRLFANGTLVGQTLAGSDGRWEITSEPLRDGIYFVTAQYEDLAGWVTETPEATEIEIDTLAPNTPFLDLVAASDTGRSQTDNVTADNTLTMTMTTTDPNNALHLSEFNYKFRIFVRPEGGSEVLSYDSVVDASLGPAVRDADGFTSLEFLQTTLAQLPDGVHNFKLEVEDRAGNISHDFWTDIRIDTVAPLGVAELDTDSDTGIWGFEATMTDRITADETPNFVGSTEANAIVSIAIDGQPAGLTVANPLSGDDAFQPPTDPDDVAGNWQLESTRMLSQGEHTVLFRYEDLAGNQSTSQLQLFTDAEGPRIANVTRNDEAFTSLFRPKPDGGPDPLVPSIVIHFLDTPQRTEAFQYEAVFRQLALEEGNYSLVGDANGNIPIVDVNILAAEDGPGVAVTQVELVFAEPLPDDRFTITVRDTLQDPAGNALDGESGAAAPFEGNNGFTATAPIFPTGDGEHGGDFVARFTIDSRPEIGTWAAGSVWVDTNGNFVFDPENIDFVNRDIVYKLEFTSDDIFAGNFAAGGDDGAAVADGFDKLAAYGWFDGSYRWLVDVTNDGVPDIESIDPNGVNGLPFAGRFDNSDLNGDEVGIFDGRVWHFDTNHDFRVDRQLRSTLVGYPVVGDFDGNGFDDLATWTDDRFQIDLDGGVRGGWDGVPDATFRFGFIGVRERPVAADMDQDGFDDLGLWVPDREGVMHNEHAEWYFLISDGNSVLDRIEVAENPIAGLPEIDFTPIPFGPDLFARFGDEFALPIVGNFDPPVLPANGNIDLGGTDGGGENPAVDDGAVDDGAQLAFDVNGDGHVSPLDALLVLNELNAISSSVQANAAVDAVESPLDWMAVTGRFRQSTVLLVINELNRLAAIDAISPAAAGPPESLVPTADAVDQTLAASVSLDGELAAAIEAIASTRAKQQQG